MRQRILSSDAPSRIAFSCAANRLAWAVIRANKNPLAGSTRGARSYPIVQTIPCQPRRAELKVSPKKEFRHPVYHTPRKTQPPPRFPLPLLLPHKREPTPAPSIANSQPLGV